MGSPISGLIAEAVLQKLTPTQSLRSTLVRVKDRLPAQEQRNVVYKIPCSECSSSYVGQTCRQFGTRMKEHKGTIRRQDENSLLALQCLTTGHAVDWDRDTVVGKGTPKYKREYLEAWNTTSVNQSMNLDPGYKALREHWRRRTRTRLPPVP